jgi:hypothetical protein
MNNSEDFNSMLHALRSKELQLSEPARGTMVSVGCSDLGYFDWIDSSLGRPTTHIGLEFYRAEPEGLPNHVKWIANTAGNMSDVGSDVADLVFAGQTVEHLWWEELAGFFIESARVLREGGRLMFDSPNRRVTTRSGWNHPEHTVELVHEEAVELCKLAGFDLVRCVGHWLCLDPSDGDTLLPLTEVSAEGPWNADRRIAEATHRPDLAFSWWIEAVRVDRPCNVIAVIEMARGLSRQHFPNRVNCLMQSRVPNDGYGVAEAGQDAWLVFGPLAPLPPGDWLVRFEIDAYAGDGPAGHIEVSQTIDDRILSSMELPATFGGGAIDLPLNLHKTEFGLEFRVYSNGVSAMRAKIGVEFLRRGIA